MWPKPANAWERGDYATMYAQLTGCDAKTVARYVAVRDAGGDPLAKTCRPRLIDAFMPKVEELRVTTGPFPASRKVHARGGLHPT